MEQFRPKELVSTHAVTGVNGTVKMMEKKNRYMAGEATKLQSQGCCFETKATAATGQRRIKTGGRPNSGKTSALKGCGLRWRHSFHL